MSAVAKPHDSRRGLGRGNIRYACTNKQANRSCHPPHSPANLTAPRPTQAKSSAHALAAEQALLLPGCWQLVGQAARLGDRRCLQALGLQQLLQKLWHWSCDPALVQQLGHPAGHLDTIGTMSAATGRALEQ